MKRNQKIYSLIYLLIFAFPLQAEDLTLVVKGIGDSKANAIIDAQRNALRTSYGEYVSTNLTTLNNQLTKNENVNLVSGTIKDFKVISESENDFAVPPIIEVLMEVTVNKGKLVSFAKAIGDNVEIQGSLFGAEIRQQEINKNNEAIAMDHLAKKAETMSAFFDYEISVESPKRNPVNEDDYFIYSSLSLTTNQNYRNLTVTVLDTISQIAMRPDEIKKYEELGTPYYRLDIIDIKNPICSVLNNSFLDLNIWKNYNNSAVIAEKDNPTGFWVNKRLGKYGDPELTGLATPNITIERLRDRLDNDEYWLERKDKSDITQQKGVAIETNFAKYADVICNYGKVNRFYLRAKESFLSLQNIRQQIEKSIVAYEVSRKTRTDSKFIFPFSLSLANIGLDSSLRPLSGSEDDKKDIIDPDNLMLKERILKRQTDDDKKKVSDECVDELWPHGTIDICYKDTDYTEFAKDVSRIFAFDGYRPAVRMGYYEAGGFFSDPEFYSPLTNTEINSICQSRVINGGYTSGDAKKVCGDVSKGSRNRNYSSFLAIKSQANPVFAYMNFTGLLEDQSKYGMFFVFPDGYEFSVLKFEDVVDREKLSTITGYVVDPDKLTKR